MQFSESRINTRWIIVFVSFLIVSLILWNTYSFFQIFKKQERDKMEQWAAAQKALDAADINADASLPYLIIESAEIPIILTEKGSIINSVRIDEDIKKNKTKLPRPTQNPRGQRKGEYRVVSMYLSCHPNRRIQILHQDRGCYRYRRRW